MFKYLKFRPENFYIWSEEPGSFCHKRYVVLDRLFGFGSVACETVEVHIWNDLLVVITYSNFDKEIFREPIAATNNN